MKIVSFKHKGLEKFYLKKTEKGVLPKHRTRLNNILRALEKERDIQEIRKRHVSYHIHQLKGSLSQYYSIAVDENWRLIFQITTNDEVILIDYLDYH